MRTLPHFTALFRTIASIAAASTAVVACSSQVSREGLTENVCTNGQFDVSAKITPKVPVDYSGSQAGEQNASGLPCTKAKDVAACKALLAAGPKRGPDGSLGCGQSGCFELAYTRGDEVGFIVTMTELREFLSFQSIADGALVMSAKGHRFDCSENNASSSPDGYRFLTKTGTGCGASDDVKEHLSVVSRAGEITTEDSVVVKSGDPNCAIGRRPEGLAPARHGGDGLGRWLAEVAHLEAASVVAFERLAEELRALGAPTQLVERARQSAADEIRHARVTAKLARRHGGTVLAPRVKNVPLRSLFELACENAAEGCVRETFGAIVAVFQASHARNADIRAAMAVIARDETMHSALAWELAAWAEPRLSADERARARKARRDAARRLREELASEPRVDVRERAGVPGAGEALRMFDAAAAELWAA